MAIPATPAPMITIDGSCPRGSLAKPPVMRQLEAVDGAVAVEHPRSQHFHRWAEAFRKFPARWIASRASGRIRNMAWNTWICPRYTCISTLDPADRRRSARCPRVIDQHFSSAYLNRDRWHGPEVCVEHADSLIAVICTSHVQVKARAADRAEAKGSRRRSSRALASSHVRSRTGDT